MSFCSRRLDGSWNLRRVADLACILWRDEKLRFPQVDSISLHLRGSRKLAWDNGNLDLERRRSISKPIVYLPTHLLLLSPLYSSLKSPYTTLKSRSPTSRTHKWSPGRSRFRWFSRFNHSWIPNLRSQRFSWKGRELGKGSLEGRSGKGSGG